MTGSFILDWAILSISLFNTVLLLWLSLTVLLNAERRTWGIWLTGGGLLMGGAFFVSHSAMLGHGMYDASEGMNFWWRVGWMPVVALPLAWYVVVLWYAGFWEDERARLRRRHRSWFYLSLLLAAGLAGLFFLANPLPSYWQVTRLDLSATPSVKGIPLLILVYPFYTILCIGLSVDVLLVPKPSERMMGDLARQRARPWLMAASLILLLVSLLVAGFMGWVVMSVRWHMLYGIYSNMALTVAWFDLAIASLIGVATLLLGQAVVSYEVFTGKTLPQRGFLRHWRSSVAVATGYAIVVGWGLTLELRPIYSLLLTTMLMVAFFALLGWRSFAERERYMDHLRPFVASQRLYEHLVAPGPSPQAVSGSSAADVAALFTALCDHVLGAQAAYLIPLDPLGPLGQPLLAFHEGRSVPLESVAGVTPRLDAARQIVARFDSPRTLCMPLDPGLYGDAVWAVPLWGERGPVGVMLLGEKRDGGLYTQEEIEIARASGERLIDTQATAEMARRLMALLRQRIAQVRVMEGRGRRVLHDDILPQLHAAILHLGALQGDALVDEAIQTLVTAHRQLSDLIRDILPAAPHALAQQGLVAALRTLVDQEFASDFSQVEWQVSAEAAVVAARLPLFISEVVFFAIQELVRNAARHGRGQEPGRPLRLNISMAATDGLSVSVEDDGVGLDRTAASALPSSGSNSGLQFHGTMLAAVGASLQMATGPGTRATIVFPPGSLEVMASQENRP